MFEIALENLKFDRSRSIPLCLRLKIKSGTASIDTGLGANVYRKAEVEIVQQMHGNQDWSEYVRIVGMGDGYEDRDYEDKQFSWEW